MNQNILALDVGTVRTGVAVAGVSARLPRPLTTIDANSLLEQLPLLMNNEGAVALVVGLPRNLEGDDTDQTRFVRSVVEQLNSMTDLPIFLQDEALTSRQAEAELDRRGVSYTKADIDALAATLILDDFCQSLEGQKFLEEETYV